MKKIMFILAFVGAGLFVNASNGKVHKIKLPKKMELKILTSKEPTRKIYVVNVSCGYNNFWYGCCWDTAEAALQATNWWLATYCH